MNLIKPQLYKQFVTIILLCLAPSHARVALNLNVNALDTLKSSHLINNETPIKLHLGCGERHFDDYINIDFPPSEHTWQRIIAADVYADLTAINFPHNSVDEIRSHHVFEHFDRPTALALLCKWHQWLKPGGTLIIETPDLEASLLLLLNPDDSYEKKQAILRHIFGSHEASWATHYDGWYKQKFETILTLLGFGSMDFIFTGYLMTRNITVTATKTTTLSDYALRFGTLAILETNLVNRHEEQQLLEIWYKKFNAIFMN